MVATLKVYAAKPGSGLRQIPEPPVGISIATALAGNVDSAVADRLSLTGGGAVVITSAIGATPTVKVDIQGSMDGTAYYNIPYALVATPRTFVLTQITITTAVTTTYLLQELVPWRYFKCVQSANTNVTLTEDVYLQ